MSNRPAPTLSTPDNPLNDTSPPDQAASGNQAIVLVSGVPPEAAAAVTDSVVVRALATDEPWPAELAWPLLVATPAALAAVADADIARCLPVIVGEDLSVLKAALPAVLSARQSIMDDARREAEADATLEQFVHAISHDLKGPIQGVLGLAGLLTDRPGAVQPDLLPFARRIETDAQRMSSMIDALTRQSRLGRGGVRMASIDVEQLIEDVFAGAITEFGARIPRLVCDGPMPHLIADAEMLEIVLAALVDNAIRYNDRSPPRVHVAVVGGTITVRDDGIGIPQRAHTAIFEMFTRVDRKRPADCGAGLAIAQRAAELMGARIQVTSEVGLGSAFHIVGLKAAG